MSVHLGIFKLRVSILVALKNNIFVISQPHFHFLMKLSQRTYAVFDVTALDNLC
jgi:hypothetical protein